MTLSPYQPSVHRLAVLTACVALLPIVVGAAVTTLGAGMAFLDWPTSDGQNMLAYPWLSDIAQGNTAKAIEHGHRLGGIVIGLCSIALVVLVWRREERFWVKMAAVLVLLGVIAQGILGGVRVLADERMLAMAHGGFAAWVFTLMAAVALVTSRSWRSQNQGTVSADVSRLKPLAIAVPVLIFVQYTLGGLVRHLGTSLHEHLGLAFLVLLFVGMLFMRAVFSRVKWLWKPATVLFVLLLTQIGLGAGAWVTKFGFPASGYVAVQRSTEQLLLRTSHSVVGILLFMMSVIYALRVFRLDWLNRNGGDRADISSPALAAALPVNGGAA